MVGGTQVLTQAMMLQSLKRDTEVDGQTNASPSSLIGVWSKLHVSRGQSVVELCAFHMLNCRSRYFGNIY